VDPLRVVHVDAGHEWRGGQTQLLHLATRGPRPAAVVVADDAPLGPALERSGVEVVRIPFRGRWWGGGALATLLDELRPDVVAAHDGHGAALALRQRRWPVVVHRRVDFVPSWLGYARYRRAAGVIAVSGAVAAILRRGGVDRVAVVHDGVDAGPFLAARPDPEVRRSLGVPDGVPLAVAVGALVDHKGHDVLVRALPEVPDLVCAILGEGPRREALLTLARRLGVAARVHLVGARDDVARWLATADLFVHPSVEEGLGQAVIEAGLAGAPVVTTDAGGLPELGVGRTCAARDPTALAAAIRDGLRDPARADRVALAERFSVERMVRDTLAAYRAFRGV
jgi:glycosyltransferase involved in cell wall biosynthesis